MTALTVQRLIDFFDIWLSTPDTILYLEDEPEMVGKKFLTLFPSINGIDVVRVTHFDFVLSLQEGVEFIFLVDKVNPNKSAPLKGSTLRCVVECDGDLHTPSAHLRLTAYQSMITHLQKRKETILS